MAMIEFSDKGLFCSQGGFYIDPWKPVDKAIITHAHSDHARPGNKHYLCHQHSEALLKLRLGDISVESLGWNDPILIHGVKVSLHPAGHIIGSAQVRLEYQDEVWVVSGDYKTEDDGISQAFEPVTCNTFITESTFGLPIYNWKPQEVIYRDIGQWILQSHEAGKIPVLIGYSLGKAQRLLRCVSEITDNIFVHGAIWNIQEALSQSGFDLPVVKRVMPDLSKDVYRNAVILAPPSADGTPWMKRFYPYSVATCSGWMQVRGNARRRNADASFVLSDHADWKGLLTAVQATGASKVYVTHGFQSAFSRYLDGMGISAAEVATQYGGEEEEEEKPTTNKAQEEEMDAPPNPDDPI
jgi:putative mRNA 3-end processing factor